MSSTFSVITNLPSLVAQHHSTQNQQSLQRTLFRLSTGQRLFWGGEDPVGLALADGLNGQIRTLEQSIRNANDASGLPRWQTVPWGRSRIFWVEPLRFCLKRNRTPTAVERSSLKPSWARPIRKLTGSVRPRPSMAPLSSLLRL